MFRIQLKGLISDPFFVKRPTVITNTERVYLHSNIKRVHPSFSWSKQDMFIKSAIRKSVLKE